MLLGTAAVGVGSTYYQVIYWRCTGDLRLEVAVQFGTILAVPSMLAAFPSKYSGSSFLWGTVGLYVIAKMAELLDHQIATVVVTGGASVKALCR